MSEPDAGSGTLPLLRAILPVVLTVATGGGAILGGLVSADLLTQIITAVAGTIGGSSIVKHLLTKVINAGRIEWRKLPPWSKNLIPIALGIALAITTGQEITDTLPIGSLDDGAIIGALASFIYKIIKPSKPTDG